MNLKFDTLHNSSVVKSAKTNKFLHRALSQHRQLMQVSARRIQAFKCESFFYCKFTAKPNLQDATLVCWPNGDA